MSQVLEQTRMDQEKYSKHFAVLETGNVQDLDNGSNSFFSDQHETPSFIGEKISLDFTQGRVSAQTKSEITFCFTMKKDLPTEDSSVDFLRNLQFLQNTQWATELTIDKNDWSMKRESFFS